MEHEMMELNEKIFETMKRNVAGFVIALSVIADSQIAVGSPSSELRYLAAGC
jgi:hypothetical protein